jgi:hypothetical protein
MNKRKISGYVLLVIILISTVWYTFAISLKAKEPKPNLVFIRVDELTGAMLSCYQSNSNQTPNIDLLAYQGKKYIKCFADSSFNTNTFLGYIEQAKAGLQSSGYRAVEFSVLSDKKQQSNQMNGYSADICTNNVIGFVKTLQKNTPFAIFMNYGSLTSDTDVAARHAGLSVLGLNTSLYAIDENVGRLFKFFEDMGIADNTVFVFVATNNQANRNPMPLIVRYPSKIQPNSVSSTYCTSSEIFPSIFSMATIHLKN